jgi:hypothetical protein
VLANLHREGGPASAVHVQHPARKPAPIPHAVDITNVRLCRGDGGNGDRGGGNGILRGEPGLQAGWTALPEGWGEGGNEEVRE